MIIWTKEFETGSEKLDQQHRLLIDNINTLEELLETTDFTREDATSGVHLVDFIESYSNFHFKGEEHCMGCNRCPDHSLNQQEHEQFSGFIRDFKSLYKVEGFNKPHLRELHQVMRSWISVHILKIDTRLKPYIQKRQSGLTEMQTESPGTKSDPPALVEEESPNQGLRA
jgi:hemerythrin